MIKSACLFLLGMTLVFGFIPSVPALDYGSMDDLSFENDHKDEQVVEEMAARYIEMMLTKPLFQSDLDFFEDEDEDSGMFGGNSQEKQFFEDMLSKELAKQLAKQDILGLKKMYLNKGISSEL